MIVWGLGMNNSLGHYLEMRDYVALEKTVEKFLETRSWEELLGKLREIQDASQLADGWTFPLTPGKMRDGLIELLSLHDMTGLDTDFLETFRHLEGKNLEEIRDTAREYSITLLREQIRRGNTFFIDADAMIETDLTILVPGIIESRTKEIKGLESKPPLSDIYSTYYGFAILTSGGLSTDVGGIPTATKEQLNGVMQQLGSVQSVSAKQLKFSYLSFGNCSDHLKTVLWNLLKMCIGGIKSQKTGIEVLGTLGDSRALDLMHAKLETVQERKVKEILFDGIGRIGSSKSYNILLTKLDNGRNLDAVKALGLLRDSRVRDIMKQFRDRYYRQDQQQFIEALGNTRDTHWLPYLYHQVTRRSRMMDVANLAAKKIEAVERHNTVT